MARDRARELLRAIRATHSFHRLQRVYPQVIQFIEDSQDYLMRCHHADAPLSIRGTLAASAEEGAHNKQPPSCRSPSSALEHMLFCSVLIGGFCRGLDRIREQRQQQQQQQQHILQQQKNDGADEEVDRPREVFFGDEGRRAHHGGGGSEVCDSDTAAAERVRVHQVSSYLQTLRALLRQLDRIAAAEHLCRRVGEEHAEAAGLLTDSRAPLRTDSASASATDDAAAAAVWVSRRGDGEHDNTVDCPALLYGLGQMEDCAQAWQLHLRRRLQAQMDSLYWNAQAMAQTIYAMSELSHMCVPCARSFRHARRCEEPRTLGGDGALEATRTVTPLRDPLTQRVIGIPARGRDCTHLEVFDLVGFIRSVSQRRHVQASSTAAAAAATRRGAHASTLWSNRVKNRDGGDDYAASDEADGVPGNQMSSHSYSHSHSHHSHGNNHYHSDMCHGGGEDEEGSGMHESYSRGASRHAASRRSSSWTTHTETGAADAVGGRCPWCQHFIPMHMLCVDHDAAAAMESYRSGEPAARGRLVNHTIKPTTSSSTCTPDFTNTVVAVVASGELTHALELAATTTLSASASVGGGRVSDGPLTERQEADSVTQDAKSTTSVGGGEPIGALVTAADTLSLARAHSLRDGEVSWAPLEPGLTAVREKEEPPQTPLETAGGRVSEEGVSGRRAAGRRKLTTQHALQWDFVTCAVCVVESERMRRGAVEEVTGADATASGWAGDGGGGGVGASHRVVVGRGR